MRLKYFLRGLGMGIIITTIILTISHISNRKMTDNEIIERAMELGMSFPTSDSGTQTETQKQTESVTQTDTGGESQTETDENQSETSTEQDSSEADTTDEGTENETEAESTNVESEADTADETQTESETETTTEQPAIEQPTANQTTASGASDAPTGAVSCSLNIVAGMSSRTVCDMLKQNGIIDDAADFDRYLIRTGYDDKIRTGEVWVSSGMTYEELTAALYKK